MPTLTVHSADEMFLSQREYIKSDTVYRSSGDWYLMNTNPAAHETPQSQEPASTEDYIIEWEEPVQITNNDSDNWHPKAVISGSYIYLAWYKVGEEENDIYFIMSTNYGQNWANLFKLSDSEFRDYRQSIIAEVNKILVAWTNTPSGVHYRRSTDGGQTWFDIEMYDWYTSAPALCKFRPDSVFLFFGENWNHQDRNYWVDITCDFGESWGVTQELGEQIPSATYPGYGVSHNGIHVTGESTVLTLLPEIFYDGSPDGGNTWTLDYPITENDSIASQWPALGADYDGNVYVTWFDYKYSGGCGGDILMRHSMDDGITWEDEQVISFSHEAHASSVAGNEYGVFVIWEDGRHYQGGLNKDLYFRASFDYGETWQPEQRLTFSQSQSWRPFLLVENTTLHLFWSDNHNDSLGLNEIFYMRGNLIQTGVSEDNDDIITKTMTLEIYPNPYNTTAKISYSLNVYGDCSFLNERTTMEIFNILGQRIELLIDEYQTPGEYILSLSSWNKSSGIYFIKLTRGGVFIIRKVTLLR